jgi:hypothetical protein
VFDDQLLLFAECVEVETERAYVRSELFGGLFECHEDAGLPELGGTPD